MSPEIKYEKIVVLGIGNILQRDEGVGVRVIQELAETRDFPDRVQVIDGGVLGLSLMGIIEQADYLIVVDAVKLGGARGISSGFPGRKSPAAPGTRTACTRLIS